jgi:tetratricopeptide (TPR) repeat protein
MRGWRGVLAICVMAALVTCAGLNAAQQVTATAKEAYARAVELESKGNDPAALALLWQASGQAPRDADVQNRLGEALGRMGALDAAIEAFRRAIAERPDFVKAASNLSLTLVQAGRGAEALSEARAFLARSPGDPNRHFALGLAQAEQDVEQAIATFRHVLEIAPRHTLARYNLALVLQRADRLDDAARELERAIAIEPRPEAYYALGVVYWHRGELERATRALGDAVAAEPGYAAAHYTLGAVLKDRGDWKRAIEALRRAIRLRPDQPGAYVTLARVLQLAGDADAARTQLAEGERLRQRAQLEHEALVWTAVGTGKLEAGELIAALDDFRRATAAFEPYAPAHYQMGRVLQRLGAVDASRAAFDRARQLNPSLVSPAHSP